MRQRRTIAVVEQRRNDRAIRDFQRRNRTDSEQLDVLDGRLGMGAGAIRERKRLSDNITSAAVVEVYPETPKADKPKRAKKARAK